MADVFGIEVEETIDSVEALRRHARPPSEMVQRKAIDRVDPVATRFIAAASLASAYSR